MANKILSLEHIEKILQKLTTKIREYVSEVELEERLTDEIDIEDIWNVIPSEDVNMGSGGSASGGSGGGGSGSGGSGGTTNYEQLYNLPSINGITLQGNVISSDILVADINHEHLYSDIINAPAIPTQLSQLTNDAGFITTSNLAEYATKTEMSQGLNLKSEIGHMHLSSEIKDLQDILDAKANIMHTHTTTDIDGLQSLLSGKADAVHIHSYASLTDKPTIPTKISQLENDTNLITSNTLNVLLAEKADKEHIHQVATTTTDGFMSHSDKNKLNSIEENANNYMHPTYDDAVEGFYKISVDSFGHVANTTAVTTEDITNLIDDTLNLGQYVTDAELTTELTTALADKATVTYVNTELANKADKSSLHTHTNKDVIDNITNAKIIEWDNKSTFSGNYNDLSNKPTIPTTVSELANDMKYQTDTDVAKAIADIASGGEINLDDYVTKDELLVEMNEIEVDLSSKANTEHTHTLDNVTDLELITIEEVNTLWDET